jgi:hypothetical protein
VQDQKKNNKKNCKTSIIQNSLYEFVHKVGVFLLEILQLALIVYNFLIGKYGIKQDAFGEHAYKALQSLETALWEYVLA